MWLRDARMDEDQANHQHGHLFQELKQRFPEVPDSVVTSLMRQASFLLQFNKKGLNYFQFFQANADCNIQ